MSVSCGSALIRIVSFKGPIPVRYSASRKYRCYSSSPSPVQSAVIGRLTPEHVIIGETSYARDDWTNVTEKILSQIGRKLHLQPYNPLCHLKRRIVDYFYKNFQGRSLRSPLFTVFDSLEPVVNIQQNFDSLLVARDHPSRAKSDCYYLNKEYLLRAHTSAHQAELIKQGMNNFLVVGDVYRRDEIDRSHYPIFHQVEGVHLCGLHDLFQDEQVARELRIFDKGGSRTGEKQASHTTDAVMVMTQSLQATLLGLVQHLFGKDVESRWVDTYFPFTHPSWELEVKFNGEWMEMLGCGIMEQDILSNCGAVEKIGWAFGLGLERLAMRLYEIPDIRLFWSTDPGFLHQFRVLDPYTPITYKAEAEFASCLQSHPCKVDEKHATLWTVYVSLYPVSVYPSCSNDISFWLPGDGSFNGSDFYDLVRSIGGDKVEQVRLVDEFHNKGNGLWSHCYRIVYRDIGKTLTKREVNHIHRMIQEAVTKQLRVVIR